MILEVNSENLRDIAAAVHAAKKREPSADILGKVQQKVLGAIQRKESSLELEGDEAQALRNALLQRAYDQRRNTEGLDYSELADRIGRALDVVPPDLDTTLEESTPREE